MNKFNDDLSLQEIFNLCYLHVLKQGEPSFIVEEDEDGYEDPICLYRGPNGLMCAVGPFLTEQEAEQYEGDDWSSIDKFNSIEKNSLVLELQICHDGAAADNLDLMSEFMGDFKERASYVARKYWLTIPEGESK